ncbi:MAG: SGNH/GDSL hydrolase family protein [Daejeonella sp.]|uniref:SGNH/GDSL hydrolase family protein n=1 Tax=Daejeonella sp. TaxID=2805397 RepID=UPI0027350111|nr:SGNH/GDSL hydrolase family protein [Daejeonella sp.]MDP3467464.1 SGNH/GDSL hydrolase family protein [Daejeonella sp.]
MKKVLLFLAVFILMSSMQIQKPVKVIFFGDSITRAGVTPGGYITLMQEALRGKVNPEYELIGSGIGGNKVYDLFLRFEEDVLSKKPDVVVMYVGVNDVWHKQSSQTGTDPDKFIAFYTAMIKKLQASGIRVIVCTPAAIGERTDFSNAQDGDLNRYSTIIRELAQKYSCGLVDLRKAFLDYNLKNNPDNKESGILTTDRVHLNPAGNKLLADLMIKALSEK